MSLPVDGERPYAAILTLEVRTPDDERTIEDISLFTVRCCPEAETLWLAAQLTTMWFSCSNSCLVDPTPALLSTTPQHCRRCGMRHDFQDRVPIDACPACGMWMTGPQSIIIAQREQVPHGIVVRRDQWMREVRRALDMPVRRRWEEAG